MSILVIVLLAVPLTAVTGLADHDPVHSELHDQGICTKSPSTGVAPGACQTYRDVTTTDPDGAVSDSTLCGLPVAMTDEGCTAWKATDEAAPGRDPFKPTDIEAGPNGRVYTLNWVTGPVDHQDDDADGFEMEVTAYEAASGARLWRAHVDREFGDDVPIDLEVGPEGDRVFVTGWTWSSVFAPADLVLMDYLTVGLNASTGERLWETTVTGEPSLDFVESTDFPIGAAVSSKGVLVLTGFAHAPPGNTMDWLTVAYETGTGEVLWKHRVDDGSGAAWGDRPFAVDVSSDGSLALVTGELNHDDASLLALKVTSGAVEWQTKLDPDHLLEDSGSPATGLDVVAGRHDAYVRVVDWHDLDGNESTSLGTWNNTLVRVDLRTGETAWNVDLPVEGKPKNYATFGGDSGGLWHEGINDNPMVLHPSGSTLYVTHASDDHYNWSVDDKQITAFDTATGATQWTAPFTGRPNVNHLNDCVAHTCPGVFELGLSDDGAKLFAGGIFHAGNSFATEALQTRAYDATSGEPLWRSTHRMTRDTGGHYGSWDFGGLAVGSDHVFIHGDPFELQGDLMTGEYVTLAYDQAGPDFTAPAGGVAP